MKQLLNLLILCTLTSFMTACGNDDKTEYPNSHRGVRECLVNLSIGGDFIDQSDVPLTRADGDATKTYIGINVRTKKNLSDNWQRYAYGLFDDPTKMQLKLTTGYYYDFEATTLSSSTDTFEPYVIYTSKAVEEPFQYLMQGEGIPQPFAEKDMNKFIENNTEYFPYINKGTAKVFLPGNAVEEKYRYPRVNRYYGRLNGFVFTSDMENIEIPVKRKNFGIQIKAVGLPEGTTLSWRHSNPAMVVSSEGNPELQFLLKSFNGSTQEEQTWEDVYSLYNLDSNTTVDFTLEFTWRRTSSISEKHSVTFTPEANVMKVLKLDFSKQAAPEGVNISIKQEDTEMTTDEEEYIWM